MKKQKKQNLLTAIIIILVIALVMLVGSIIYEETINMSKQPIQNTNAPAISEKEDANTEKDEEKNEDETGEQDSTTIVEDESENDKENVETPTEDGNKQEYVGEEESPKEEPEMTTDEKVIDLVKKEWGEDSSVTFSIEKKNGSKYRVAVRNDSTTVLQWYEVDIETWEVSEY